VTLTANVSAGLGRVSKQLDEAIQRAGVPPRGVKVNVRGQLSDGSRHCRAWEWDFFSQSWSSFFCCCQFPVYELAFVVLSTFRVVCGVIFHAAGDANHPERAVF